MNVTQGFEVSCIFHCAQQVARDQPDPRKAVGFGKGLRFGRVHGFDAVRQRIHAGGCEQSSRRGRRRLGVQENRARRKFGIGDNIFPAAFADARRIAVLSAGQRRGDRDMRQLRRGHGRDFLLIRWREANAEARQRSAFSKQSRDTLGGIDGASPAGAHERVDARVARLLDRFRNRLRRRMRFDLIEDRHVLRAKAGLDPIEQKGFSHRRRDHDQCACAADPVDLFGQFSDRPAS